MGEIAGKGFYLIGMGVPFRLDFLPFSIVSALQILTS